MSKSKSMVYGKKVAVSAAAAVMALSAASILAAQTDVQQAYAESKSADGYVTASAYRAAESSPELLGITGVGTDNAWTTSTTLLDWSAPNYYIMGTDRNVNANSYLYNAVQKIDLGDATATPTTIVYKRQGGPMAKMYAYGTAGQTASDQVWLQAPDIIVGTGAASNTYDADMYTKGDYATPLANLRTDLGSGYENYSPVAVGYNSTNIYTMMTTMYDLAGKADTIVANSNGTKRLRYGNATTIASKFEIFVKGIQGEILQGLAEDDADQKTVASVAMYDNDTGKYLLVKTGVEEGTATQNRLLEATQNVAINLADDATLPTQDVSVTDKSGKTTTTNYTVVTKEQLEDVDLILVGGQAQGTTEMSTDIDGILATFTDEMVANSYWAVGSAGSLYGVTMNSVENGQNTARVLGCLYDEYVDQSDLLAYYYQTFYHINSGDLADTIANAMDNVRNWNVQKSSEGTSAYLQWNESDVADYNEAAVEAELLAGAGYLEDNAEEIPVLLTLTDEAESYLNNTVSVGDVVVREGSKATATAEVTGFEEGATLTYQWQKKVSEGVWKTTSTKTDVNTVNFSASHAGTWRVVVSDGTTTATSDSFTVTAKEALSATGSDIYMKEGGKATGTVTATGFEEGATLTYKWQYKNGTTWKTSVTKISDTGSCSANFGTALEGKTFRVIVSDGKEAVCSNEFTVNVMRAQISDVVIPSGKAKAAGTVTATGFEEGATLTYKWQYWTGSKWTTSTTKTSVTGSSTANFGTAFAGKTFRVIVSDGAHAVCSNTFTVTQA